MGKKVKNKGRNPRKLSSRVTAAKPTDPMAEPGAEGGGGRELCGHYREGEAKSKEILLRLHFSSVTARCEDCREEPGNKRGGKGKGKNVKKKAGPGSVEANSGSGLIWVCLDCNRFACGGGVSEVEPYGHARRHAKQERHSLAVRFDNPLVGWCFTCNSSVPIEMPEVVNGEPKQATGIGDALLEGNAENGMLENERERRGYAVRGLMNLGNTCFFNSVMQNLLAMATLRDYYVSLDQPVGPLTMALKKLFVETDAGTGMDCKSGLNPKNLFGCICSKAPQFRGYQQQDSHELLRYLLDGLSTEELSARKLRVSSDEDKAASNLSGTFVDVIFGGQLSSTVCCKECCHTSTVYEPFLDLSLPVPAKKVPPKKVQVTLPKRGKLPLREGYRGRDRRVRERVGTKGVPALDNCKTESVSFASEFSIAGCSSSPEQEQAVAPVAAKDLWWMDYIETTGASEQEQAVSLVMAKESWWMSYSETSGAQDDPIPVSQSCDVSSSQDPKDGPFESFGEDLQSSSELQSDICSKEPMVPLESSRENCYRDEVSSQVQDSEVILLPYGKVDSTTEEMIGPKLEYDYLTADVMIGPKREFEHSAAEEMIGPKWKWEFHYSTAEEMIGPKLEYEYPADIVTDENPAKELNCGPSSSIGCEHAEADFDGLGNLFNEPEITANAKMETSICEEIETSWLGEISSESNQDEVDDTNAPVSVDSCLACFTKPEVLSNEHAWHCENCSKILQLHNPVNGKVKWPAVAKDNHVPTVFKISDGGKSTTASEDLALHPNMPSDASADKKQLNKKSLDFAGSDCTDYNSWQSANERSLESVDSSVGYKDNCPEILKDGHCGESEHNSQYLLSCSSPVGPPIIQLSSGDQENDSCSVNESNSIASDIQFLEAGLRSSLNLRETVPQSSCESDNFSEVEQVEKNGSDLHSREHATNDSQEEEMKEFEIKRVMRDATKRILINKTPHVLTIHLKRFSQDSRGRLNKLSGHVTFQETLDLWPYMDTRVRVREKISYRLVGVVEHSGNMRGGHYVAYVRGGDKSRGKTEISGGGSSGSAWFYASDAHVCEVSLSKVLESEAYILFYEKV